MRAGIRSRHRPKYRCLQLLGQGWVVPLVVPAMFLEYEEVLSRPETLEATGLTQTDVANFLTGLAAFIEPVLIDFNWRPLLPDPGDDMIANCAINGMAHCVVTNNVRHLRMIERRFGIPVLEPRPFVEQVDRAIGVARGYKEE
jgi:predicted nucleic acid-binding protein